MIKNMACYLVGDFITYFYAAKRKPSLNKKKYIKKDCDPFHTPPLEPSCGSVLYIEVQKKNRVLKLSHC